MNIMPVFIAMKNLRGMRRKFGKEMNEARRLYFAATANTRWALMNIYPAGTNARIVRAGSTRSAGGMIGFILRLKVEGLEVHYYLKYARQ